MVAIPAEKFGRIETAHARVIDEAVLETVDGVARGDDGLRDHRQFGGGKNAFSIAGMRRGPGPEVARDLANAIVTWTSRNDAVVVFGKTLRLRQRLMPSCRAADEVRVIRKSSGVITNNQLRHFGRDMYGAIGP